MSLSRDLIDYRREKAKETLGDARSLFGDRRLTSAVNRIYYALFYEVTALLLTRDLSSSRHSGIRSLFNEHFVKTGIITPESGKFFSMMFDFRQKGDYSDFVTFEESSVKEWLARSESFFDELERVLTTLLQKE